MDTNYNRGNSRLLEISRKLFIEHRKTLLITIGAYLGICAVIGIWQGMTGNIAGEGTMVAYVLFAGLACAVAASLTFCDLASKEGCTAFLMTPGTAFDKFLPRVLTTVIGMIILCFMGYYAWMLSDVLAYGLRYSIWVPLNIYFPELNEGDDLYLGISALCSLFLFNEALYIFGSAAWPKKSFLKTTGVYIGLQIALNMIAIFFLKFIDFKIVNVDIILTARIIVAITLLIDAALFYAAYKQIQRKQVI